MMKAKLKDLLRITNWGDMQRPTQPGMPEKLVYQRAISENQRENEDILEVMDPPKFIRKQREEKASAVGALFIWLASLSFLPAVWKNNQDIKTYKERLQEMDS